MTTSLITFERQVHEHLLDVIYAQWRDLGVPFSTAISPSDEVIDPEALLWCSLEFLPTEPRLREGVFAWLGTYEHHIIRQRVKPRAAKDDPRTRIWNILINAKRSTVETITEPCYGLHSPADVAAFCEKVPALRSGFREAAKNVGKPAKGVSTVLLWSRDMLGSDIRHFLLVYLLANPGGGKLKTVQRWSGYSYRSISQTATRWETAGLLTIDHGYCHLTHPEPWRALLPHRSEKAIIVDWFGVFDAYVRLLRVIAKAGRKGLTLESTVVSSHCHQAKDALSSPVLGESGKRVPTVEYLREIWQ